MARKAKLSRQLQEMSVSAEVTNRPPPVPNATIYLMQLRAAAAARKISVPRRRLAVAVEPDTAEEIPHPVKIRHAG